MKRSKESIPDRVKKGSAPILERLNALDKDQLHAVLATEFDGQPYTSMIAYALTPTRKGLYLLHPKKQRNIKISSKTIVFPFSLIHDRIQKKII